MPRGVLRVGRLPSVAIVGTLLLLFLGLAVVVAARDDPPTITNRHGTDRLLAEQFATSGRYFANARIISAAADPAGTVTVKFVVTGSGGKPIEGVGDVSFNIAKLVPPSAGESSSRWVPYIWRKEVVQSAGGWPQPRGAAADQGYLESNGTLTVNKDRSYTYRFATNISRIRTPVGGTPIPYERNRLHRVTLMLGEQTGPTATAHFDFVPDGSRAQETRNIVPTQACRSCHGVFFGRHSNRLTVESCATCHAPGSRDAQSGESLDLKVMIHKIHAGAVLASIPGPDGKVFDDPDTPANESADNGSYALWGAGQRKYEWSKAEFPAVVENCTKCHQGMGRERDNWKTVPSRAACGSCHDTVNFATGANHEGGPQTNDAICAGCHVPSRSENSVTSAHEWFTKDPRNIPEFKVILTVSRPANRRYFVAGESPVVTVVLTEKGTPIDHTTMVEDTDGPEGCLKAGCPPRDSKFANAILFVHGPRARRNPVLTTTARVRVLSARPGPFDLSNARSLVLRVDGGEDLPALDVSGGDITLPGTLTVPVVPAAFARRNAATAEEIVAWLNGHAAFKARAIAYLEGSRVAIRSRNLGKFFALQLMPSDVTATVFGNETSVRVVGGTYPSNNLVKRANPAQNDPKVSWEIGAVSYALDPVDDLKPGTYVATVEITDRGRIDADNYQTPSVAKVTFQVKTPKEELAVAGNCASCHQAANGRGFVLDFLRHYKIFDNTAVDQCGACHDYQPREATGEWAGGHPIAKRVHAVHFGAGLNYPIETVAYANRDPIKGRNWKITFPQDVRNCETCHPARTTSGSWKTEASRLPCLGCHDSDAAKAHIKLQTYDPTPASPWNGDEVESCKVCHSAGAKKTTGH